jgi:small conductance mechanosensitive channel
LAPATLTGVCGSDPGVACRLVWDLSHDVRAAQLTESYLSGPIHLALRLIFVVALALLTRAVLHRLINRVTERAAETVLPQFRSPLPAGRQVLVRLVLVRLVLVRLVLVRLVPQRLLRRGRRTLNGTADHSGDDPVPAGTITVEAVLPEEALLPKQAQLPEGGTLPGEGALPEAPGPSPHGAAASVEVAMVAERRHQRVRALGSILRSAASVTIFGIAGFAVLGDLGINLAPLLASAGVVGIAVGFGAQNLVRDYLTGIFMLLEDQYGVGDVISVGNATGTVETVTLRITRIRDINGVVWHIRNGTIDQVGNKSQGWARAVVDFPVPYTADLATIRALLAGVAAAAWEDPALRGVMLEQPEVWGAQDVSGSEVIMRVVARTAPLRQWETERELRARVKDALDAAGIYPDPEPAVVRQRRRSPGDS